MKRILFVCTGNTCRSPMAQAFANDTFKAQGLLLKALSCGVYASVDSPASANSVAVMTEHGLCLSAHKSKLVQEKEMKNAEVVIAMTKGHKTHLLGMFPQHEGKIFTLLEMCEESGDVADPFGGCMEVYKKCGDQIKKYIDKIDWRKFL